MKAARNSKRLRDTLTEKRLVREMHALLWRPRFVNGAEWDEGWMCREHTLITAGIGALLGFRPALAWGSLALVGQITNGSPAGMVYVREHSWCMIEGGGFST
jgi:hypothetical protein